MTVALHPQASPLRAGRQVAWEMRVTNGGSRTVELRLRSSQLGDISLERSGEACYRWSDGRAFLQVVGERTLRPGESWTFPLEGRLDVEPGSYEAIGTVACEPPLPPARLRVVVDG